MKQYKHIFFDLDHTIWDFDKNAEEALQELYVIHQLAEIGLESAELFIETYTRNNHRLWAQYHVGEITKDELREARFKSTFIDLGLHPDLMPLDFEDEYVKLCPTKTNLFPHAHETLQYLQSKYTLHLISNGFKDSTRIKIAGTDLAKYFQNIIISEDIGVNKPDKAIFQHALDLAGASKAESVMIGDSIEADIRGALNFGMDAIYFNPFNLEKPDDVTVQIAHLKELTLLFMSIAKERKAIDAALDEYRKQLDIIPDELFDVTPPNGGWSFAEVYSHIMQATLGSSIALERCTHGNCEPTKKGINWEGRILLLLGKFPPVKTTVPNTVSDKMAANKISKEDAKNLIIKCRKRVDTTMPLIAVSSPANKYKHPRLGMLNAKQWFKFIRIHLQHHLKQLGRIKNKFSAAK